MNNKVALELQPMWNLILRNWTSYIKWGS